MLRQEDHAISDFCISRSRNHARPITCTAIQKWLGSAWQVVEIESGMILVTSTLLRSTISSRDFSCCRKSANSAPASSPRWLQSDLRVLKLNLSIVMPVTVVVVGLMPQSCVPKIGSALNQRRIL